MTTLNLMKADKQNTAAALWIICRGLVVVVSLVVEVEEKDDCTRSIFRTTLFDLLFAQEMEKN